jgi:hypothetical protein
MVHSVQHEMLIAESALSFLGIGAPVGAATWGNMLADSRQYLFNAPWMLALPGRRYRGRRPGGEPDRRRARDALAHHRPARIPLTIQRTDR